MSDKLPFVPHDAPQTDFLITTTNSERTSRLMAALGAIAYEKENYTAYLWQQRLAPRFMFGLGVIDGELVIGPRRLKQQPRNLGAGNYSIVELQDAGASVRSDPFGMSAIYASPSLLTNRLHLASLIVGELDISSALTSTYNEGGFSFSTNAFRTAVAGVNLVPADAEAEVDGEGVHVRKKDESDSFARLTVDEYWRLIEMGADEIVQNVSAIARSGHPTFADITGGKDSRLIFGALLAGGVHEDVVFNTITNNPALIRDLEIGTGLVKLYGGSYQDRPRTLGYSISTVRDNLHRRRSQVFGTYHWLVDSDVQTVRSLFQQRTIRLLGGGGELYRNYWQPMLFTSVTDNVPFSSSAAAEMFDKHRGKGFGRTPYRDIRDRLIESLAALPGETLADKLDAHYLHFRNRFHFGIRQSLPESMSAINVAMSRYLVAAYRGLPAAERASGRVLFDVTRTLNERLAYLPYDNSFDAAVFSSEYHRPSRFDGQKLSLAPAIDIASVGHDRRGFVRSAPPASNKISLDSLLDSEIAESLSALREVSGNEFPLDFDAIEKLAAWARDHSPRTRSAMASKLRAFTDYIQ